MSNDQAAKKSTKFPYVSLEKAVSYVQTIKTKEKGNYVPLPIAMKHCGYGPKSSGGYRSVSALSQYGLLDARGKTNERSFRPSQSAMVILESPNPTESADALKAAALKPAIFRQIWDKYERKLPSADSLKWELTGKGNPSEGLLSESAVVRFIEVFIDTLEYAGLLDDGESDDQVQFEPQTDIVQGVNPPPKATVSVTDTFDLPLPLGTGREGILQLPKSMSSAEWNKLMSVLDSVKNLKGFLLIDEPPAAIEDNSTL